MCAMLDFADVPRPEPHLDHVLVEASRLRREQRDRIVSEHPSVTIAMVASARGTDSAAARQWLFRHREAGRLVSVEHGATVLIPSFQLDDDLEPRPDVASHTVRMVKEAGMSGWEVWTWWVTDNGWLSEPPYDALRRRETDRVAQAVARLLDADR